MNTKEDVCFNSDVKQNLGQVRYYVRYEVLLNKPPKIASKTEDREERQEKSLRWTDGQSEMTAPRFDREKKKKKEGSRCEEDS